MAECVECYDEYPDARYNNHSLGYARCFCIRCADKRKPKSAYDKENSRHMVLDHKGGYKLVRTREDVRAISTGKPNGGTLTESR